MALEGNINGHEECGAIDFGRFIGLYISEGNSIFKRISYYGVWTCLAKAREDCLEYILILGRFRKKKKKEPSDTMDVDFLIWLLESCKDTLRYNKIYWTDNVFTGVHWSKTRKELFEW